MRGLTVLVAALFFGPASQAGSGPRIAVDPESWNFGRALQNRVLEKPFVITNLGDADLVVDKISTTCGCAAALLAERTLRPGQRATLKVSFETRAASGPVERKILLRSNDRAHDPLEIKLLANVVAP